MFIHGLLETSKVNGPGNRSVVWLQGCRLNCSGCWNKETHPETAGKFMTPEELAGWIVNQVENHRIEGVTFSGGEPMHQAVAVLEVIFALRERGYYWLSFGMYTGYTPEELRRGRFYSHYEPAADPREYPKAGYGKEQHRLARMSTWRQLQPRLDFAVMGRYYKLHPDYSRPLCSSKNQELVLFSKRYQLSDFAPQQTEVTIEDDDALVTITGFPPEGMINHA